MPEIENFYQAMLRRLETAFRYLDEFDFGQLPSPQKRLYWLPPACAEAALSAEIYRAPLAPEASRINISYSNIEG